MRYGSLCSGIGGLDLAVESVWRDASPAWFCEFDQHAARVLARHWPGVPILPDLKTQDWSQVEPVELVTAGYPCQPFSHAGKRQGTADPRHLWPYVIDAVRVLRPRLVVLENVAGHLGLGFDSVLGDLAEAGFDAEWSVVPASAAGACHRRERLFVVATDASVERRPQDASGTPGGEEPLRRLAANGHHVARRDGPPGSSDRANVGSATPHTHGGRLQGDREPNSRTQQPGLEASRSDADRRGSAVPDAAHVGCEWGGQSRGRRDGSEDNGAAVADTACRCEPVEPVELDEARALVGAVTRASGRDSARNPAAGVRELGRGAGVAWGDYAAAIERWEHVLGRPAPAPTDERGRLAVTFVEWMQGFDEGWVDGLPRTAALRCLGNAVVQQQGVLALSMLSDCRAIGGPSDA